MPSLLRLREEGGEEKSGPSSLGLGWLLPLAIGGGILLFIAVGLLLSWKIRARKKPCTTRVYSMGDVEMQPRSRSRLTKRQGLASEYSGSRFSSRLSLSLPPVLPPLPSYDGIVGHQRGRTRERAWVDEDALHGPKVRKSLRDSWIFNSPSWFGRAPTLPEFEMSARNSITATAITPPETQDDRALTDGQQQMAQAQRRDDRPSTKQNQTGQMLAIQHGALRNWSRPGAQLQYRQSITESSLQDILRLTEQRLRTGGSQVFEKPITSSSTETSLGKPSDSAHSLALLGHSQSKNLTAAPQKRPADPRPLHRRNSSVYSVCSTINSLAGETPNELELLGFGARQTFGRLNIDDDDEPQIDLDAPLTRQRSASVGSHASSSLSTLYSVGDAEDGGFRGLGVERRAQHQTQESVIAVAETKPRISGPRPLRRQNLSITRLGVAAEEYSMPMPLRPICANPQAGTGYSKELVQKPEPLKPALILQPPKSRGSDEVRPKGQEATRDMGYRSLSETSKVTESESDNDSEAVETPSMETTPAPWCMDRDRSESPPQSPPGQAATSKAVDRPSSPVNEDERMQALTSDAATKQTLPIPPSDSFAGSSNSIVTKVATRPRLRLASDARRASICSSVGSDYDGDGWLEGDQDFKSHSRRTSTLRSARASQAVGSTVAQLRRMNSTMSTYSVASIASTMVADAEASQTTTGGHEYSHSYSSSRNSGISARHYLNLGGGSATGSTGTGIGAGAGAGTKSKTTKQQQQLAAQRRRNSRRMSVVLQPTLLEQPDHGKENQAPALQTAYGEVPSSMTQGSAKHACTFSRDLTLIGKAALGPVHEIKRDSWRESPSLREVDDDLSMYDDGDGFLQTMQETEAKSRCLRM